jgi:hypothetical protein
VLVDVESTVEDAVMSEAATVGALTEVPALMTPAPNPTEVAVSVRVPISRDPVVDEVDVTVPDAAKMEADTVPPNVYMLVAISPYCM